MLPACRIFTVLGHRDGRVLEISPQEREECSLFRAAALAPNLHFDAPSP
jgi:hypothetical protein